MSIFTMPKLSPTMETGVIAKWLKKEGDFVEAGDALLEVATDKATVEHEAIDEGFLRKIVVPEGGEAAVNQPIALFTVAKDDPLPKLPEAAPKKQEAVSAKAEAKPAAAPPPLLGPNFAPEKPLESYRFERPLDTIQRVSASPLAKKIAEERGLDLTTVKGSGPSGRIVEKDLEIALPLGTLLSRKEPEFKPGSYVLEPLTPMRRAIGKKLQQSKTYIPHFYVEVDVDAAPLFALKEQLKGAGLKITVNDLVVRAAALTLRKHPEINVGYSSENDSLIRFQTIDISIAVTVDQGLMTPIIRHADYKSVSEISSEMRALAARAREGKLEEHEYKGGSFTVSNLGMYGVSRFSAILNPPQGAILAVSGIADVPVVREGQVVPGKKMALTLSCDHRIIDGALASQFLGDLKKILESPITLFI